MKTNFRNLLGKNSDELNLIGVLICRCQFINHNTNPRGFDCCATDKTYNADHKGTVCY